MKNVTDVISISNHAYGFKSNVGIMDEPWDMEKDMAWFAWVLKCPKPTLRCSDSKPVKQAYACTANWFCEPSIQLDFLMKKKLTYLIELFLILSFVMFLGCRLHCKPEF